VKYISGRDDRVETADNVTRMREEHRNGRKDSAARHSGFPPESTTFPSRIGQGMKRMGLRHSAALGPQNLHYQREAPRKDNMHRNN
jgi:hypothetical protein